MSKKKVPTGQKANKEKKLGNVKSGSNPVKKEKKSVSWEPIDPESLPGIYVTHNLDRVDEEGTRFRFGVRVGDDEVHYAERDDLNTHLNTFKGLAAKIESRSSKEAAQLQRELNEAQLRIKKLKKKLKLKLSSGEES